MVTSGHLTRGSFVQLLIYQAQKVKGKKILIITDIEVLTELKTRDKIGDPKALDDPNSIILPGLENDAPQNTTSATAAQFYGNTPQRMQEQAAIQQAVPRAARPANST